MRVIWYTAMSMDGRIADAEHSLDFLGLIGEREDDWREEFREFIGSIDAVLLGAGTLRWLLANGHGWPHGDLPTWLVSHDQGLIVQIGDTEQPVRRVEGEVGAVLAEIEASGAGNVWLCGGGDLAAQALAADGVDEVIVTVAPTVLGAGPALFDGERLPVRRFRLAECHAAGGDAARLRWTRDREAAGG